MGEPVSIAASFIGIVVPALHGTRLLLDDLRNIADAPNTIANIHVELTIIQRDLESLQAIEDPEWDALGGKVADQSRTAVSNCSKTCDALRSDLQRWTKRTRDGKLSWRDRANVGFFKERQIKAMIERLQSCKLTINSVVGVATFYSSIRNGQMTQALKQQLAETGTAMTTAVVEVEKQIATVDRSLRELRLTDPVQQCESDEDFENAEWAMEDELETLRSSQMLVEELIPKVKMDYINQAIRRVQDGSVSISFGENNSGFQLGVSYGEIHDIALGRR